MVHLFLNNTAFFVLYGWDFYLTCSVRSTEALLYFRLVSAPRVARRKRKTIRAAHQTISSQLVSESRKVWWLCKSWNTIPVSFALLDSHIFKPWIDLPNEVIWYFTQPNINNWFYFDFKDFVTHLKPKWQCYSITHVRSLIVLANNNTAKWTAKYTSFTTESVIATKTTSTR